MAKSNLGNVLCGVTIRMKGVTLVLSSRLENEAREATILHISLTLHFQA